MSGLSHELTLLILDERRARSMLDEAAPKLVKRKNARLYWKAVEALLRHLALREPLIAELQIAETLEILSLQAGYLGVGAIPELISDVATRGNPAAGPSEKRDIAIAVAYRQACQPEGLITGSGAVCVDNTSPTQTLADWYGVLERTVQRWARYAGPNIRLPIEARDRIDVDILAKEAGERYKNRRSKSNNRRANHKSKRG